MVIIKNEIQIDSELEKVFSFLANPENLPKWNYYLVTVKKIKEGNPVIGSQYHQVRKKDAQYIELTALEGNKLIEFSSIKSSFIRFKRRMFFSATANGSLIDDIIELRSFIPSFLLRLFTKKIQEAVKANLYKLKELLETCTTTLQDGRVVTIQTV